MNGVDQWLLKPSNDTNPLPLVDWKKIKQAKTLLWHLNTGCLGKGNCLAYWFCLSLSYVGLCYKPKLQTQGPSHQQKYKIYFLRVYSVRTCQNIYKTVDCNHVSNKLQIMSMSSLTSFQSTITRSSELSLFCTQRPIEYWLKLNDPSSIRSTTSAPNNLTKSN